MIQNLILELYFKYFYKNRLEFIDIITNLFFIQEFLKTTVDIADIFGLYFVMTKIAGKCEIKYLIAGVGWATADLIMTK